MAPSVILPLLFLFFFSSSSSSLLGGPNSLCTRGPAHWCQDAETAKSWAATKYCQQKVWKKDESKEDASSSSSSSSISSVPMVPVVDQALESIPMTKINAEAQALPAPSSSSSSSDMCTYCEEVVNYAKILLGNPNAEEEIKALLTGMCAQLGPLKEACVEFVQENIEKIVHTLAHLDTKQVCVELHMCSADGVK